MTMLRTDMSMGLRGNVMRSYDLNEDFLEIVFRISLAKLAERTFREQFSGLDDADRVTELLDFAHDMRGKDDRLSAVATFADERRDGACGHYIKTERRLVENHDRRIVDECTGDGGLLLHARRELVA